MAFNWSDIIGVSTSFFKIGFSGFGLKNSSGTMEVRNTADNAYAPIVTSKLNVSGDVVELNSDAASSGADWKFTIQRPSSGMTAAVTLTLPTTDGSPNEFLRTDGFGVCSWASAGDTSLADKLDTTTLGFGTASPAAMFTTGANDVIEYIEVVIDTAFNGSPSASVGITGTTSKYMPSTAIDLTQAASTRFVYHPGLPAGGSENLIITYAAGGASAGSARFIVHYATPA